MKQAFENFEKINKLDSTQKKHRAWLKEYEGLQFGVCIDGKNITYWKNTRYKDNKWNPQINLIGRIPNRTVIEFDGDEKEAKKYLDETEKRLKENGWGYIRSSHKGKSDYLWIEFSKDMKDNEVEAFLKWIAPEGSEIDLNFASSNRIFPVLFAVHRKHSYFNEIPMRFVKGKQIETKDLEIKVETEKGFQYKTFKKATNIFTAKGQAKGFLEQQPFFYDKTGMFWIWNHKDKFWELTDEVDILNVIEEETGEDVISSKRRNEIINSLKQEGRKNIPAPIKPNWIQFKGKIYDILSGKSFEASPKYFVTNPINWEVSFDPSTPNMDKIFKEWVGEKYIDTLYQILAYSLLPDYPIHRLFCFIGAGLNGKSCFLRVLKKFVGYRNITATELDVLLNSRFEVTRLYKKLVCIMGETNFSEMSKTSIIKKLTGQDVIGFEYKNKMPFEDSNYAKIMIATNNLPTTTDKTIGFYRRWMIIDFPNKFSEKKDILQEIPEEEYNNLATKCIVILKELLEKREFKNEGSIEERIKRYEDRSDPLEKFINESTKEDVNGHIWKFEFEKKLNQWCKDHRFREISEVGIGKKMKEKGYNQGLVMSDWLIEGQYKQLRAWLGIKWKEELNELLIK